MTTREQRSTWRRSSYTGSNGDCVEVATGWDTWVRDTKNRQAGHLVVPQAAWRAFLDHVR